MNKYYVPGISMMRLIVILLFITLPFSCSDDAVLLSDSIKGIRHLEFKISVSDFNESSDASPTEQENAVKKLALFLFKSNGQELVQENRFHDISNGKIKVTIPVNEIGEGLKAYLVANEDFSTDPITEAELLEFKTRCRPEDFISKGFPMRTDGLIIKAGETPLITITALLQRVPSAFYVQVEENADTGSIHNNSYQIEIEGLQIKEGALFNNTVTSQAAQGKTDYSSKLTAVNTPENIAYFYQSQQIKVYITPKDPNLGKVKIITIENSKSAVRNKKFLLKIKPIRTIKRAIDFKIQVAEWGTEVILVEVPLITDVPHKPGTLFAEGVSLDSGWYDVNKSWGRDGFSQDSNFCWAAAAANMLQWWQDRYVADGNILSTDIPNRFTSGREDAAFRQLAIFELFASHFTNVQGSEIKAMIWYLPKFFPKIFPNTDTLFYHFFDDRFPKNIKEASDFIINGLRSRGVLAVSTNNPSHVRTLWGCKYNPKTGIVESVYVTDSDDRKIVVWQDIPLKTSANGKLMIGAYQLKALKVLYAYPGRNSNVL